MRLPFFHPQHFPYLVDLTLYATTKKSYFYSWGLLTHLLSPPLKTTENE